MRIIDLLQRQRVISAPPPPARQAPRPIGPDSSGLAAWVTRDQLAAVLAAILEDYESGTGTLNLGSRAHFVSPMTMAIVIMSRLRKQQDAPDTARASGAPGAL